MSKLLISFWLSSIFLVAARWDHIQSFALKKDQWQKVFIHTKSKTYVLRFDWTLYKNGGLVMHVLYPGHHYQPLLYKTYHLNSFKINLFSRRNDTTFETRPAPYALIVFKAYDLKKGNAYLDLLIKDYGLATYYKGKGK